VFFVRRNILLGLLVLICTVAVVLAFMYAVAFNAVVSETVRVTIYATGVTTRLFFVTLPLLAFVVLAAARKRDTLKTLGSKAFLLLVPLLVPLVTTLCAETLKAQPGDHSSDALSRFLDSPLSLLVFLGSAMFVVARLRHFRWLAFSVVLLESWFAVLCFMTEFLSGTHC